MRPARLAVLVWCATACGRGTAGAPPVGGRPAQAVERGEAREGAGAEEVLALLVCEQHDGLVARPRAPIEARWDGHLTTGGEGVLDVYWCGPATVSVARMEVGAPARWSREYDHDVHRLRHGVPAALAVRGSPAPGQAPVLVVAVDEAGGELRAEATLTSVDDPRRAAAMEACRACGGTWGSYGMAAAERCDCPTADAGKRCTSDDDCESACIATSWEPVAPAPASAGAAAAEAACAPGERLEQQIGRCHDRQLAFGCRPRIRTPGPRCVRTGVRRYLPSTCVD